LSGLQPASVESFPPCEWTCGGTRRRNSGRLFGFFFSRGPNAPLTLFVKPFTVLLTSSNGEGPLSRLFSLCRLPLPLPERVKGSFRRSLLKSISTSPPSYTLFVVTVRKPPPRDRIFFFFLPQVSFPPTIREEKSQDLFPSFSAISPFSVSFLMEGQYFPDPSLGLFFLPNACRNGGHQELPTLLFHDSL